MLLCVKIQSNQIIHENIFSLALEQLPLTVTLNSRLMVGQVFQGLNQSTDKGVTARPFFMKRAGYHPFIHTEPEPVEGIILFFNYTDCRILIS